MIVSIECRAWAGNVEYQGGTLNRAGSVTFELLVDGATYSSKPNVYSLNERSRMTN